MKTRISIIVMIVSILLSVNLFGQEKYSENVVKIKATLDEAFLKFDEGLYQKAHGMCERLLALNSDDALLNYYKAYSDYRLMVIAMVNKNENKLEQYLELVTNGSQMLIEKEQLVSEAKTLLATAYMIELAINHNKGQVLAPKIYKLLDEALEADPQNPRVHLTKGMMLVNTPEFFGGSVKGAISEYKKSIKIFESTENSKLPSWGYLETLSSLGQAYQKDNNLKEAKAAYEKALSVNQNFGYVKYELLPSLEKQIGSSENDVNKKVGKLIINFYGFDSNDGTIRVALANGSEKYLADTPFKAITAKIEENKAVVEFDNLPFGEYAVSAFHDEDNDEEFGTGMFGIPTEGYGFSNDARGSFGPADYEDAKFTIEEPIKTISILID